MTFELKNFKIITEENKYMKEREQPEYPTTVEEMRHTLLEHMKDAKFGTVEFQASIDYFNLEHLHDSLATVRNNSLSEGKSQEDRAYWESRTRITETQVALLERQIQNNQSRVPGYSKAYWFLVGRFDDLSTLTYEEADKKYPSDKDRHDGYEKHLFNEVYNEIKNIIYTQQDKS